MRRSLLRDLACFTPFVASALLSSTPARAQDPFRSDFDSLPGVPAPGDEPLPRPGASGAVVPPAASVTYVPDRPAPPFGERGELVLRGELIGGFSRQTFTGSEAERFSVRLSPGLDVFVARRISLGLTLSVGYSDDQGYGTDGSLVRVKGSSFSVGPRVGYLIALGDTVALWPTVTLGFATSRQQASLVSGTRLSTGSTVGAPTTRWTGLWVGAYAPLVVQLAPHFFVGFGPTFSHDFAKAVADGAASSAGAQGTSLGAAFSVGGFWGGPEVADRPAAPVEPGARHRRFGDAGQIVLTNELDASVWRVRYAGTDGAYDGFSLEPGIDAFLVDRVSMGVRARLSASSWKGLQPDGTPQKTTRTAWALGPSVGVEAPIDPRVSAWFRIGIDLGSATTTTKAARSHEFTLATLSAWTSAFLLMHVSPRFFAGIGPSLSTDVSGKTDDGRDLKATSWGAGGILGGWL